jgi:acylphosphatase
MRIETLADDIVLLLRIRGRVQGVGYRAFVRDHATRLRLRGWTRNRTDGSVEVLLAGDRAAASALIAVLRRGPAGARVVDLLEREAAPDALAGASDGFEVLPTL